MGVLECDLTFLVNRKIVFTSIQSQFITLMDSVKIPQDTSFGISYFDASHFCNLMCYITCRCFLAPCATKKIKIFSTDKYKLHLIIFINIVKFLFFINILI